MERDGYSQKIFDPARDVFFQPVRQSGDRDSVPIPLCASVLGKDFGRDRRRPRDRGDTAVVCGAQRAAVPVLPRKNVSHVAERTVFQLPALR